MGQSTECPVFVCVSVQEYLTSGDWDDVEDLEEKLQSYKCEYFCVS